MRNHFSYPFECFTNSSKTQILFITHVLALMFGILIFYEKEFFFPFVLRALEDFFIHSIFSFSIH